MQDNLLNKTSEWTSATKQFLCSIQYLYKYHPFRTYNFYGNNTVSVFFSNFLKLSDHPPDIWPSTQQTGARSKGNMPSEQRPDFMFPSNPVISGEYYSTYISFHTYLVHSKISWSSSVNFLVWALRVNINPLPRNWFSEQVGRSFRPTFANRCESDRTLRKWPVQNSRPFLQYSFRSGRTENCRCKSRAATENTRHRPEYLHV